MNKTTKTKTKTKTKPRYIGLTSSVEDAVLTLVCEAYDADVASCRQGSLHYRIVLHHHFTWLLRGAN